jgi:hypothetical protein
LATADPDFDLIHLPPDREGTLKYTIGKVPMTFRRAILSTKQS